MNVSPLGRRPLRLMTAILGCCQLSAFSIFLIGAEEPAPAGRSPTPFHFRDTAAETGLAPLVEGVHAHGAAWGDGDGDGRLDLYVGTFHTEGPASLLLRNKGGQFELDGQKELRLSTRATGVIFADLDNDGDLDLYVASMPGPPGSRLAERTGRVLVGCSLLRNEGGGRFTNVSPENGACPAEFGGRSAAAFDYDGDGLLDLLVGEDPLPGYNGSPTKSSRLFHNLGGLQFADVSRQAGLPEGVPGLGVAAADLNNDGRPDFFLASAGGGNRMFLNAGGGKFREAAGSLETFAWPTARGDDMVCGVAFGDVNRDGLLDVVIGQHYERPWLEPVANRLYLNRGIHDGTPTFEDVTERVGLVPLPMKSPHVEIQDFDNDGWPDVSTTIVKFAGDAPHPVIFKHLGIRDGLPHFHADALAANDFPTAEDRQVRRTKDLFDKIVRERTIIYTAPGPSGDYDNDGRLDMFLASWWVDAPSLLLHNETAGGNWLDVTVAGGGKVNRQGIGSRIYVYPTGKLGDRASLLGCREISVGFGYASGQPAIAHFGLGDVASVDIEVILPHNQGRLVRTAVRANQRLALSAANAKPAARQAAAKGRENVFPPTLPDGKEIVSETSAAFLKPPTTLKEGVAIAATPPTVDFVYYPGQTYAGKPWSNWGDGVAANGKYYSAIGDHLALDRKGEGEHGSGTGRVFEYDPQTRRLRQLVDLAEVLDLPAGHYTPGKIHTRLDLGCDGWLYFGTHRGSTRVTTLQNHYRGDWIIRTHLETGRSEVVVQGPVPEHCIPTSVLDPDRLIFYGGTAPGTGREDAGIQFFAYDVPNRKLLYVGPDGPARYLIFARSTGRAYYVPGRADGPLMRFDPATGQPPAKVPNSLIGVRSATQETADGFVYTVSLGQGSSDAALWSFNTRSEESRQIGTAAIGTQAYVASLDVDPAGRVLYYVPGAHGGSDRDGSPVVQFDVHTGRKKVIAFLEPFFTEKYGLTLKGTYSTAIDPAGDKLYITWNVSRGSRAWDCCGLAVVHLPESER